MHLHTEEIVLEVTNPFYSILFFVQCVSDVCDCVVIYLPGGISVAVVAEVISDPLVDTGQSDFGLLAGLHGHTDEGGVRVRRLDVRVSLVVHLIRTVAVRHDAGERLHPAVGRGCGLSRGQRHADGGGVPSQR